MRQVVANVMVKVQYIMGNAIVQMLQSTSPVQLETFLKYIFECSQKMKHCLCNDNTVHVERKFKDIYLKYIFLFCTCNVLENPGPLIFLLSMEWVDYVEEPMKYQVG